MKITILLLAFAFATKTFADPVISKKYETEFYELKEEVLALDIAGLSQEKVTIVIGDTQMVKLELDLISDKEASLANYELVTSSEGGVVSVRSVSSTYSCRYAAAFGKKTVKGLCLMKAKLILPKGTKNLVLVEGKKVFGLISSTKTLISLLKKATFSSDKVKVLAQFVTEKKKTRSRYISIAEVIEVMKIFGSFDGEEVAKAFSSYVIDPLNASQVKDYVSSFDQEEVIALLGR